MTPKQVLAVLAARWPWALAVLVLFYGPYQRGILRIAHLATRDRRGFAIFLGALLLMPVALMAI